MAFGLVTVCLQITSAPPVIFAYLETAIPPMTFHLCGSPGIDPYVGLAGSIAIRSPIRLDGHNTAIPRQHYGAGHMGLWLQFLTHLRSCGSPGASRRTWIQEIIFRIRSRSGAGFLGAAGLRVRISPGLVVPVLCQRPFECQSGGLVVWFRLIPGTAELLAG